MTTQQSTPDTSTFQRAQAFVDQVMQLCDDPGKRAALRSGLGRPLDRCHRMHQVLAARVPPGSDTSERAHYAVAAMIAALPPHARAAAAPTPTDAADTPDAARPRNFGQCLAEGVNRGALRESAAEARLNLLTRQSVDGVHRHLPAAVRILADRPASVDWAKLLVDLRRWDTYRDQITRHWLQSFYRTRSQADREAAEQADRDEHDSE